MNTGRYSKLRLRFMMTRFMAIRFIAALFYLFTFSAVTPVQTQAQNAANRTLQNDLQKIASHLSGTDELLEIRSVKIIPKKDPQTHSIQLLHITANFNYNNSLLTAETNIPFSEKQDQSPIVLIRGNDKLNVTYNNPLYLPILNGLKNNIVNPIFESSQISTLASAEPAFKKIQVITYRISGQTTQNEFEELATQKAQTTDRSPLVQQHEKEALARYDGRISIRLGAGDNRNSLLDLNLKYERFPQKISWIKSLFSKAKSEVGEYLADPKRQIYTDEQGRIVLKAQRARIDSDDFAYDDFIIPPVNTDFRQLKIYRNDYFDPRNSFGTITEFDLNISGLYLQTESDYLSSTERLNQMNANLQKMANLRQTGARNHRTDKSATQCSNLLSHL